MSVQPPVDSAAANLPSALRTATPTVSVVGSPPWPAAASARTRGEGARLAAAGVARAGVLASGGRVSKFQTRRQSKPRHEGGRSGSPATSLASIARDAATASGVVGSYGG